MTEGFSLLGGPLHRLACRTGLVRGGTDTTAVGLALGGGLWLALMTLAFADGIAGQVFSLSKLSAHVRLLIVIPLLFHVEALVDPRITSFIATLRGSGTVPARSVPALEAVLAPVVRWKDSWLPDAICMLAAVVVATTAQYLPLVGVTAGPRAGETALASALLWACWAACLALFRFLLLRCFLRLMLWVYLLFRISRLELHLVPTHPDGVAGLGYLEVVQSHYWPLVAGLSAVQSASLVEELSTGAIPFNGIVPAVAAVVIVDVVLFVGPLFLFFSKLWACQVKGLRDYMELGADYVSRFERKWVDGRATLDEPLLGTADLQSLADLNNSVAVVRNMRLIPASRLLFMGLAFAAVGPMAPLLLFQYPLSELALKFFSRLTGF